MSHPAADRQDLAAGLALERRTVRSAFAEELRYAAERLEVVREEFAGSGRASDDAPRAGRH